MICWRCRSNSAKHPEIVRLTSQTNRQTSGESASLPQYLACNTVFDMHASTRHISSPEDRITSIKHCAPRISSKMVTIDECIEFALKNIGLWWRYGISRHCDKWKYIIIGRIFESEIILIPPSLKISENSSNGSYRNTDEVWWRYEISRSCDEWTILYPELSYPLSSTTPVNAWKIVPKIAWPSLPFSITWSKHGRTCWRHVSLYPPTCLSCDHF